MAETKVFDLEFVSIDFWSRPVWKVVDKEVYFCSTDTLLPDKAVAPNGTPEEINAYFKDHQEEVVLLGGSMDDDPDGRKAAHWQYNFIESNG